ncbi:CopG family antitoxin [Desulfofundulus thermobenzoicus]|nr:CopG family antitoxin [Desulfofundulus thermobenzoicus]
MPDFKTVEEEAEFWEKHSVSDYWDELNRSRRNWTRNLNQKSKPGPTLKR